ncbi:hypothetical protein J4206_05495 [Candidatus Woesearchaeota archaeon]|nr:hypothetical protein [Candidatus Woesearchaeota archaeon]
MKIETDIAIVDYGIEKRKGKIIESKNKKESLYKKGDYVIIQGGIVIQKIEKKEAIHALRLYKKAIR